MRQKSAPRILRVQAFFIEEEFFYADFEIDFFIALRLHAFFGDDKFCWMLRVGHLIFLPQAAVLLDERARIRVNLCLFVVPFLKKARGA